MYLSLLKLISMLSGFIGIVCGFLALLPHAGGLILFVLMCLSSVIVLVILIQSKVLQVTSVIESAAIGGIIGFIAFIAFSVIYMPLAVVLSKVFNYYANYGAALALNNSNLFIIIVLCIFMAALSAGINAFTGFLTYYFTELIENISKK